MLTKSWNGKITGEAACKKQISTGKNWADDVGPNQTIYFGIGKIETGNSKDCINEGVQNTTCNKKFVFTNSPYNLLKNNEITLEKDKGIQFVFIW